MKNYTAKDIVRYLCVDSPAPSKPKPTNTNNNMELEQRLETINGIIDRADNRTEPLPMSAPMSAYVFLHKSETVL